MVAPGNKYRIDLASLQGVTQEERGLLWRCWPAQVRRLKAMSERELMTLAAGAGVSRSTVYLARAGNWPPSYKTALLLYAAQQRMFWPHDRRLQARLTAIAQEIAMLKASAAESAPRRVRVPEQEANDHE